MKRLLLAAVALGGLTASGAIAAPSAAPLAANIHAVPSQAGISSGVTQVDYYRHRHHWHHRHWEHRRWRYYD